MDYVISTQRKVLVVEAKKVGDTFTIPIESLKRRTYRVGGILRTSLNVKEHLDQVISYCAAAGIEYAVVTNGRQWLIFRGSRIDGGAVLDGQLIAFRDLEDIETNFVEFWNLLSKPAVLDGSLQRALHPSMASRHYRRLTDEAHDRVEKVSRNSLALMLTPLIEQYLQEITDAASNKLLLELYVQSRRLSEVLNTLEHRISLALSPTLIGQHISPQNTIESIQADVEKRVKGALARKKGETVVLLGRVGSGKTTFVNHFLRVDLKVLFKDHLLVNIDYRDLEPGKSSREFFYEQLRRALAGNEHFATLAGQSVRKVYAPEIREMTLGPLRILEQTDKARYEERIASFLEAQYTERTDQYYVRTLRYCADKLGVRCVVVFDNVDQLKSDLQQEIFTFAHSIVSETHAVAILTMWEETYVRSKRGGALAAYPTSGYALPQLSIVDVLRRRLQYIVRELRHGGEARDFVHDDSRLSEIADFLELVEHSLIHDRLRARFFLESIAMGNLRRAMGYFSGFLTSGHTDADKMLSIVRKSSGYLIPLHEFIKSIGLEDNKSYKSDQSPILNLYTIADESRPTHFTKIRILEYLYFHRNRSAAAFGVGFVAFSMLRSDLEKISTSLLDIEESLKVLAEYSLVENDIYDADKISNAYRITPAGRYYIRYLASRFAYLDLVYQDTPISDATAYEEMRQLFGSSALDDRFRRVRIFLKYLDAQEELEYSAIISKSDSIPLRKRFLPEYTASLESDIRFASRKRKPESGVRTPYRELRRG
jgi:DNA-binding HxlR family transcriptional regulator